MCRKCLRWYSEERMATMRYSELMKHWKGCCNYCYQREYGVPPNDPSSATRLGEGQK